MARLQDLPPVIRREGVFGVLKRVYGQINEDNVFTWAAALAYSWLFAIFPFFLFLLTLLPYLPRDWKDGAKQQIADVVYQLPHEAAVTIYGNVQRVLDNKAGGLSVLSIALTLWAAAGGMNMTMAALDKAYDVERSRPFYKQRPLAIGLTLIVVVLILTVLVLIPIGTIATRWAENHVFQRSAKMDTRRPTRGAMPASTQSAAFEDEVGGATASRQPAATRTQSATTQGAATQSATTVPILPAAPVPGMPPGYKFLLTTWQIGRFTLGILLMLATVAIIYHFGPNVKQRWRLLTPGSVFTVVVWMALGAAFRAYIDKYGKYDQTYGAVGGVAILLLFFYIDAVVLLVGAEINSEVDYVSLGLEPGATDFTGVPWRKDPQAAPAGAASPEFRAPA